MSLKQKVLLVLLALVLTFGGGVWVGYEMDRGDVDPQDHITTVFTPYEDGLDNYLAFLDRAQKSVHIAAYSYTHPRITDKLIELKKKRPGIEIQVLLDFSQTEGYSAAHVKVEIARLRAAGIEVVIGTSEKSSQIMHHKYTIVDLQWVEDGSWNYSRAADKQANLQNYIRSPKRAREFYSNWKRMHVFMKAQEAKRNSGNKR